MVLQVSVCDESVKAPALNVPLSVVVAVSPPERFRLVPQAKPRVVGLIPPVEVILPLKVAEVAVIDVAS